MKTFNVFQLKNKVTGVTFYCKGINSQVPDEERFINKLISMAENHPTPGKMYRTLKSTLKSEWGVTMKVKQVSKEVANETKRMLIQEDRKCESSYMTK